MCILYGSESGNTENLAKQLSEDLERRGIETTVEAMNDFDVDNIMDNENILFLTSTAGQGEFPRNAKDFYSSLLQMEKNSLKGLNFSVFGLGDHGYVNFNKAAKQLEKAVQLARTTGSNYFMSGLYAMLEQCYREMEDFKKAYHYASMQLQIKE